MNSTSRLQQVLQGVPQGAFKNAVDSHNGNRDQERDANSLDDGCCRRSNRLRVKPGMTVQSTSVIPASIRDP